MEALLAWIAQREGIAHRADIVRAGFSIPTMRAAVRAGHVSLIRRAWLTLPSAPAALVTAARAGGRVSCVSFARMRGWWMPESVTTDLHLHMVPGSGSANLPESWPGTLHWTKPIAPMGRGLVGTIEDALSHLALCLPFDAALVVWESASRQEHYAPEAMRRIRWTHPVARDLAACVEGLSDSGLETLVVAPLRRWGVRIRQQVYLAGRPVDVLIGDRLVLQIDGYQHHSSSAQRSADIAHDAELRLRGYTVVRVSYRQVVHEWPSVERMLRRAVAAGLHRAGSPRA